mgnify:CR=1 FL=1
MKQSRVALYSIMNTVGVVLYIALVAWFMTNAENFSSQMPHSILVPMVFLTLFVFSAAVVGLLIFGRPIYMFMNGSKKESLAMLSYTILALFVFLIIGMMVLVAQG